MLIYFLLVLGINAYAQEDIARDSTVTDLLFLPDSITSDGTKISKDAVDMTITFSADGYRYTDLVNKKMYLHTNAVVKYGTIELKADSIVMDMETSTVYATGVIDSTGKMVGKPYFKDGSQEFESRELTYNFKTKNGLIKNVTTEEEGGYLQSLTTKKHDDGSLHINRSKFTTCDAEDPHFYLALPKAKVYPGEKIVSGPAYMVVADIPLPLMLPFGFFPVQHKRTSGIISPKYSQEANRGYNISSGYYFVINDFLDLEVGGKIFTNGTWNANLATNYKVRYRFTGKFAFNYANNISGNKGLPDYTKSTNYSIVWSHSQDSKANPGSRFSANVNMSSSGYDKNNSYSVTDHVTTTRSSTINYSKSWAGTPFNFSTSLSQSQNVQNKTVSLSLPKASFSVSRFYPLKPRKVIKERWYHELQMQYTASLDNKINTYDSLLFTRQVWSDMQNGFQHSIPVSFQIRPFSNFSISPQVKYAGVLYSQKIEKRWDPDYYDEETNTIVPSVVDDTIRGVFYGHALTPSVSVSYSPQVYTTLEFTKKDARLQAIRHVMKPSVSFSYSPEMKYLASRMYDSVQYDTEGNKKKYSVFAGNIYGTPSLGTRSGTVSFSLGNIVEAKAFAKNDTTGKAKKIKIIESLNFSTGYNIFADSLNWSALSASYRTTLFNNLSLQSSGSFSFYGLNEDGAVINRYAFSQGQGLMRMTSYTMSLNCDVASLFKGKDQKGSQGGQTQGGGRDSAAESHLPDSDVSKGRDAPPAAEKGSGFDEFGYTRFDMPWTMRLAYTYRISRPTYKTTISQALTVNGTVKLTPKTSITYSTGYDFTGKEITMTNIGISRDLHCWEMNMTWIPMGSVKSWNFTIKAKSGLLQDLKYERRKDYHDNY